MGWLHFAPIKEFRKRKEEAARDAVAPDRLLEGENPETRYREDAKHWMGVYGELLDFKQRLLDSAADSISGLSDSTARYEAAATDMVVLKAEQERLARRLDFWRRRYRELSKTT